MRKRIGALLATFGMTLSLLAGITVMSPQSQAAGCGSGQALCMFANINSGGALLRAAKGVCGYYSNLTDQGFNDVMSSIDNWVANTQSFWVDANQRGTRYNVPGWAYVSYVGDSLNDRFSSVVWTG